MTDKKSIKYLSCAEVDDSVSFRASQAGFSDYIIPSHMTREEFDSRFWGPEGNRRDISYVALDGDEPIGLVLSGIRMFGNYLTMRCGMLGLAPGYRGTGIAGELMKLHRNAAEKHNCERLFLEVIKGNDRAISFYRKMGYVDTCHIKYFNFGKRKIANTVISQDLVLRDSSHEEVSSLRKELNDIHLHWQREMDYIESLDFEYKILEFKDNTAGIIVFSENLIPILYVYPRYRRRGYGKYMLQYALDKMPDDGMMRLSFTNNTPLESFCLSNGGERDKISQYEMYLLNP